MKSVYQKSYLPSCAHSSTIYNVQNVGVTLLPNNIWVDRENVYNTKGNILMQKGLRSPTVFSNVSEPGRQKMVKII